MSDIQFKSSTAASNLGVGEHYAPANRICDNPKLNFARIRGVWQQRVKPKKPVFVAPARRGKVAQNAEENAAKIAAALGASKKKELPNTKPRGEKDWDAVLKRLRERKQVL